MNKLEMIKADIAMSRAACARTRPPVLDDAEWLIAEVERLRAAPPPAPDAALLDAARDAYGAIMEFVSGNWDGEQFGGWERTAETLSSAIDANEAWGGSPSVTLLAACKRLASGCYGLMDSGAFSSDGPMADAVKQADTAIAAAEARSGDTQNDGEQ